MATVPTEVLQKHLDLKKHTQKQLVEKLNLFGLETIVKKEKHEEYLNVTPFYNRTDLSSWKALLYEISVCLALPLSPIRCSLKEEENHLDSQINIIFNNGEETKKEYTEIRLWLLKDIEKIRATTPQEKGWLTVNNKKIKNNLIDNLNLAKLMFGGVFFFLNYDLLIKEINITLSKKKEKDERDPLKLKIELKQKEITLNPSQPNKQIIIGHISFIEEFPTTKEEISQFINSFLPTSEKKEEETKLIGWKINNQKPEQNTFSIEVSYIEKKIGKKIKEEEINVLFERLSYLSVKKENERYSVTIPHHRADLAVKEDLIGEILKITEQNTETNTEQNKKKNQWV